MAKKIVTVCDPSTSDPYPVYALRPASNTDDNLPSWDGTDSGKLQDSGLAVASVKTKGLSIIFGGAGSEIADNDYRDVEFPVACTIKAARVLADQSGSIAIALWKDSYANFPPTDADLIDTFSISTATKSEETGLSLAIAAGSIIRFIVTSCTTITQATLALTVEI